MLPVASDDRLQSHVVRIGASTGRRPAQDWLAVEEPLAINLLWTEDGLTRRHNLSITMRTPGDDRDLALGFLLAEGLIQRSADVLEVRHSGTDALRSGQSNLLQVTLAPGASPDLHRLQRNTLAQSSCGVCGKANIEALELQGVSAVGDSDWHVNSEHLRALPDLAAQQQQLYRATGGAHAAILFDDAGHVVRLREDVGRHNALDKLFGSLLQDNTLPASRHGVLVSGRASFEPLQKPAGAGLPLFAAVGAPSSLAVELAREFNITLVGFLRDGSFNVYNGDHRIQ